MASSSSQPDFVGCSQVTTGRYCDCCNNLITKLTWTSCSVCNFYDLCEDCVKLYDRAGKGEDIPIVNDSNEKHKKLHRTYKKEPPTDDKLKEISWMEECTSANNHRRSVAVQIAADKEEIKDQYDLFSVIAEIESARLDKKDVEKLYKAIGVYVTTSQSNPIRVLSLDGGGVRGYMAVQILIKLICIEYKANKANTNTTTEGDFLRAQQQFVSTFDYICGTSTGGLIAFCLAMDYSLLKLAENYKGASDLFHRNKVNILGSPFEYVEYDATPIHNLIDNIVNELHLALLSSENKKAKKQNQTMTLNTVNIKLNRNTIRAAKRALIITAYNATRYQITAFNSQFHAHADFPVSDVLKATMAAPIYFLPYTIKHDNCVYLDGGLFANDPEIIGIWCAQMDVPKLISYRLMCIGTGSYQDIVDGNMYGGYRSWLYNKLIFNTMFEANRAFTETVAARLSRFANIERFKFNYFIKKKMDLDDTTFPKVFDVEMERLSCDTEVNDLDALIRFYHTRICGHEERKLYTPRLVDATTLARST